MWRQYKNGHEFERKALFVKVMKQVKRLSIQKTDVPMYI